MTKSERSVNDRMILNDEAGYCCGTALRDGSSDEMKRGRSDWHFLGSLSRHMEFLVYMIRRSTML